MQDEAKRDGVERLRRLLGYLDRDPQNVALIVDAAEMALRVRETAQAQALIQRGLALCGDDQSLRFRLGNLLLAAQDYAAARLLFAEMLGATALPAISYNLAYAQFGEGRAADAVATLEAVPEPQRAELPQYELLLGKSLYHNEQREAALEHLDRYLRLVPEDRETLGLKAMVLLDLGQAVAAAATARRLLSALPDDPLAHLVLGSIALEQKDPIAARAHLQRCVEVQPEMGRAWSGIGFTDLQEVKLHDARGHFILAVKYMPNHLGTWHGLAWTEMLLGDRAASQAAVISAMELDRNFAENHGTLAVLAILDGRLDDAETSIKRGLRLDKKSPSSHYARSLLLAQRGDPGGSKKLIERILTGAGIKDAAKIAEAAVGFKPGQTGVANPVPASGGPASKLKH